jgi:N-acetylneuraminic acid mutarotase
MKMMARFIISTTLFALSVGQAFAQSAGPGWTYTGSLNSARYFHTATLLPNGKVLVAAGATNTRNPFNFIVLDTAELYDAGTGTWTTTGRLGTARYLHTATLLPTGKVLVAGGDYTNLAVTNSAELYEPATGTWSPTGNLNIARSWYAATLLANGKVLVAGGFNDDLGILDSAELYDPATEQWTLTGKLNVARYGQTATLLQDGKVLIAGGTDDGDLASTLASAELYDPATGNWSVTGSLNASRIFHTATMLPNGKVLVAGGYNWPPVSLRGAELYDPATSTWSVTGNLNAARDSHSATLLPNGKVLVAGGEDWNGGACLPRCPPPLNLNTAELYDPNTATWNNTEHLNSARPNQTATLLQNGKVLVAGGSDNVIGPIDSAELYDPGFSVNANPIDDPQFFVRQQYLDFLGREPDSDGFAFWTNQVTSCSADQQCIDVKRVNVSAAFFLSIEFQQTGYLVYRLYKTAYGNLPNAPVPIKFSEFLPDSQEISQGVIVGETGWETVVENNKQAFADDFVNRPQFISAYPSSMSAADFVDALNANAGSVLTQTERDRLVSDLSSGAQTRPQVLHAVAENPQLITNEFNRAFVLMQYFGYLRRDPNSGPDTDFTGYNFWLNKLNQFNGNYLDAEMIKAFITSSEYRQRFGP